MRILFKQGLYLKELDVSGWREALTGSTER